MRLDDTKRLPSGLFHFRAMVLVELDEPLEYEDDDEAEDGATTAVGYYRIYGVTAGGVAQAAELVESEFAAAADNPPGVIRDVQLTPLGPGEIEPPLANAAVAQPGIHFRSGRIFFAEWDEDEDDDEGLDEFGGDPDAWKR